MRKLFFVLAGIILLGASCATTDQATQGGYDTVTQTGVNDTTARQEDAPSACPTPLLQLPVDLSKVTSVLYPGQLRGGDYKRHGGFRFDNSQTGDIVVTIPLSGRLERMSRYSEGGVVQYLLDITTDCGYTYRFDHLLTLTPKFQSIAETLPEARVDDSRTTTVTPTDVTTGETVATAVGMGTNTFVDFGFYRSSSGAYAETPDGLCWFDFLPVTDATHLRSLPAADSTSGSTSDYCK